MSEPIAHFAERVGDYCWCADALLQSVRRHLECRTTTRKYDLINVVVLVGGEEELQETVCLLNHQIAERCKHFGFVVVG